VTGRGRELGKNVCKYGENVALGVLLNAAAGCERKPSSAAGDTPRGSSGSGKRQAQLRVVDGGRAQHGRWLRAQSGARQRVCDGSRCGGEVNDPHRAGALAHTMTSTAKTCFNKTAHRCLLGGWTSRGGGMSAMSRATSESGSKIKACVPSRQRCFITYCNRPSGSWVRRSWASGGLAMYRQRPNSAGLPMS
jgi:hypothetical protein